LAEKKPITGRTGVLGVIGDPIEHSLSPLLHNYVLQRLGFDYCYVPFHVREKFAENVGQAFRTFGLTGLNVTIPHKEVILRQMDILTEEARIVGAVHTVGIDPGGRLIGHSTDVAGFMGSIRWRGLQEDIAGEGALLLGAGGAARAVLYALGKAGATPIYLANRTLERAQNLAGWFTLVFPDVPIESVALGDEKSLKKILDKVKITVNVTPLGMVPHVDASPLPEELMPKPGTIVYDTNYNPVRTLLLKTAEEAGCKPIGGLDMLIIQGMESLCWWLKSELPWREMMDEIRNTLKAALGEK